MPVRARELLKQAASHLEEPLARAQAQRLDGRIRLALGRGGEAPSILLQAARATQPIDPGDARETLLEALEAALAAGRLVTGFGGAEVARAAWEARPLPLSQATIPDFLLYGYTAVITGDRVVGIPLLRQAIAALLTSEFSVGGGVRWLLPGARAAGELMDDEALQAVASRSVHLTRDAGALTALPLALTLLGASHLLSGQFTAGEVCRAEGFEISAATGNPGVLGTAARVDVPVLAWRGLEAETRAAAAAPYP